MPTARENLYTTTFAVRKELKDSLREGLEKIGLDSYGELMTMLAEHGDEVAQALRPIAEKFKEQTELGRRAKARGRGRAQIAEKTIGDATTEELEQIKALLGSRSQVQ